MDICLIVSAVYTRLATRLYYMAGALEGGQSSYANERDQLAVTLRPVLAAVIDVLQRQYSRYFSLDINDKLTKETKSARRRLNQPEGD